MKYKKGDYVTTIDDPKTEDTGFIKKCFLKRNAYLVSFIQYSRHSHQIIYQDVELNEHDIRKVVVNPSFLFHQPHAISHDKHLMIHFNK